MISALVLAGRVALSRGDLVTARSFIEESLTFYRAKGMRVPLVEVLILFGRLTAAQKDYAASQALYAEESSASEEDGHETCLFQPDWKAWQVLLQFRGNHYGQRTSGGPLKPYAMQCIRSSRLSIALSMSVRSLLLACNLERRTLRRHGPRDAA